MATYTLVESITNCKHMTSDGVGNAYVIRDDSPNIVVYRYNIASDTLTDISGASFTGHAGGSGTPVSIEWWTKDSNLYCVTGIQASSVVYVHRWDGGQNWTTVFTGVWSGVGTLNALLVGDTNRMAIRFGSTNYGRTFELWATTDGTTWNSQSYDGTHCYNLYYDHSQRDELVIRRFKAGPDYRVFAHNSGNTWSDISGASIGTAWFLGTEGTYQFFRSPATALYRSTDWGVTLNAIAGAWAWGEEGPSVYNLTHEVVMLGGNSNDDVSFWNSGTLTFDIDGTPDPGDKLMRNPVYNNGYLYVLVLNRGIYVRDNPIGPVIAVDFDVSPKYEARGMDVSADDSWLYVAVLESGNPVLLKLNSDLSVDPTRAFNPGSGDAIAVVAGRQTDEGVWISGRFDGTNKVELSDDYGATWTVKDPATWAGRAYPPLIGPDDDGRMIIATDQDDDLHETIDAGTAWEERNTSLPFDVGDMDHLDTSPDELVIGSNVAAADRVEYSPNRGRSFEDISAASENFETTQIITG